MNHLGTRVAEEAPAPEATEQAIAPLSSSAAAVLGLIALGARSGYEIRRAAELSLRFFWALGPPQIYAELSRLEAAGLIEGRDEHHGRRLRRVHRMTSRGRAALKRWASADQAAPLELRDATLLQLFFSDACDSAHRRALLERIRDRSREALRVFDERVMPAAERTEQRGFGQPKLAAEFGMDLHRFIVDWCHQRLSDA